MIKKIIAIQKQLKAPKNQKNKFGGYFYRNCEDILEALKPLLAEQELLQTITDEIVHIEGRFYVKATVSITDGDNNLQTSAYAREEENKKGMDGSQITGAASSYARKYALNAMWLIDDTKDADTDAHTKQVNAQEKPLLNPMSDKWADAVKALSEKRTTIATIKKHYTLNQREEDQILQEAKDYE